MIGFLKGKILASDDHSIILETNGIGWKVFLPRQALKKMPQSRRTVKLWTTPYLRQDGTLQIYGFLTKEELTIFEALNEVDGIGPKSSLAILGVTPISRLKAAIASGDEGLLTRVSGIGTKSAQRIIVELKSRFRKESFTTDALSADLDAEEVLVSLGYSRREASRALEKVPPSFRSSEERIRQALRHIARKS